jgi:hypothetical protein
VTSNFRASVELQHGSRIGYARSYLEVRVFGQTTNPSRDRQDNRMNHPSRRPTAQAVQAIIV